MGVKLPKLPYLVQLIIIKQMFYHEIFLLSLCSSRMRNTMKHLRLSVQCIRYSINGVRVEASIEDADFRGKVVMVTFKCLPFRQNLQNIQQIRLADTTTQCRVDTTVLDDEDWFVLIHPGTTPENLVASLQTHIEPFFQSPDALLEILMDEDLGPLPEVQKIKGTFIDGLEVGTTFLEDLYEKYPNQECSLIEPPIYGELSVNSKMFHIEHLFFGNAENQAQMILENFNGKCLYLYETIIDESYLKVFIEKWVSGTAFHNLQVLSIQTIEFWSDVLAIREGFQLKRWDESERPIYYEYRSKVINWANESDPFNCEDAQEVIRDTDGKVASVLTLEECFVFCVWSEEQLNMNRME